MLYKCEKMAITPPEKLIKYNCSDEYKRHILVDKCISDEISSLWEKGIRTTGCCCGHGRELGFIQVVDDDIPKMLQLDYVNYIYPNDFGGEKRIDAFIPKTYGHIYQGYSETPLG